MMRERGYPLRGIHWSRYYDASAAKPSTEKPEAAPEMVGQQLAPHTRLPGFRSARSDYTGAQSEAEAKSLSDMGKIVARKPLPSNYHISVAINSDYGEKTFATASLIHEADDGNLPVVGHITWNPKTGKIGDFNIPDEQHRVYSTHLLHAAHKTAISQGETGPTWADNLSKYSARIMRKHGALFKAPNTVRNDTALEDPRDLTVVGTHNPGMHPEYYDEPTNEKRRRIVREREEREILENQERETRRLAASQREESPVPRPSIEAIWDADEARRERRERQLGVNQPVDHGLDDHHSQIDDNDRIVAIARSTPGGHGVDRTIHLNIGHAIGTVHDALTFEPTQPIDQIPDEVKAYYRLAHHEVMSAHLAAEVGDYDAAQDHLGTVERRAAEAAFAATAQDHQDHALELQSVAHRASRAIDRLKRAHSTYGR